MREGYYAEWKARDPVGLRKYKTRSNKRYIDKFKSELNDFKADKGCIDCGEKDWRCLDFDHRDRASKSFTISHGRLKLSKIKVWVEVEKCDVRCANCHRKKTVTNNDYNKSKIDE